MRRKKRSEPHVSHERWMVSYADFVTLLFAFFVVLFASSQVDHRKISKLAEAIQTAFQQLGIFETAYRRPPIESNGVISAAQPRPVDSRVAPEQMFAAMHAAAENAEKRKSLETIRKEMEKDLAPQIQRGVVAIQENREGLVISLREVGFYPSGSATLKPSSEPTIRRIAIVLRNCPQDIRFEGHTDNVPIHNAQFSSNWELSVARATQMLRLFITRYDFNPAQLSAAGYAQYHPIASNATAAGRARNRRVDIVVLGPTSTAPTKTTDASSSPALALRVSTGPPILATSGTAAVASTPSIGKDGPRIVPHEKPVPDPSGAQPKKPTSKSVKPRGK